MRSTIVVLTVVVLMMCAPSAQAAPYFGFGVHDDGALVFNRGNQHGALLERSSEIGSKWQRTILYENRGWSMYDRAIKRARTHHQQVQMVITCNGRTWTPARYAAYVRRVVRHFGGVVRRWSICNEPNQPGWLTPMPGYDLPTTFRLLYQAGYAAIKAEQPRAEVLFGEFSSNYYPLDFIRRVFCDEGDTNGRCVSIQADCLAYHPYQLENPQAPSKVPFTVGIGSIDLLTDLMEELKVKGLLVLPNPNQPPQLCITEFAYQSRAMGHLASRNLPDEVRKVRWWEILNIACASPYINQLILYQMIPNQPYRKARWDSSIVSRSGRPDKTFFGIKRWRLARPECMH